RVERRVLVREGEKLRPLDLTLRAVGEATTAPTPPVRRKMGWPPIVLGATVVAALGSFAFFSLTGKAKYDDLVASRCEPKGSPSDVSAIRTRFLIADVSLVVAALAAVGSLSTFFLGTASER